MGECEGDGEGTNDGDSDSDSDSDTAAPQLRRPALPSLQPGSQCHGRHRRASTQSRGRSRGVTVSGFAPPIKTSYHRSATHYNISSLPQGRSQCTTSDSVDDLDINHLTVYLARRGRVDSRNVAVAAAPASLQHHRHSIVTVAIAASRAAPPPARPAPAQLPSPPGSQGVSDDNRRAIVTQQGSPPHWPSPASAPSPLQRTPSIYSSFRR